jgi:hypothetical protein
VNFKFTPSQGWEKALVDQVQGAITPYLVSAQGIVQQLRDDGYDYAQALASERLNTTVQTYLNALKKVEPTPDTWTIILEPSAVYLEEGYSGFDQIAAGLAKNGKYSEKTGRRYIRVPFEHVQSFGNKGHPQNPIKVQMGLPSQTGTTKGSLAQDLKRLKKIFAPNDPGITMMPQQPGQFGPQQPVLGKVWSIAKAPEGPQWEYREFHTDMKSRMELEKQPSPLLSGLTKVQFQTDKGSVKSKYLTWRTATDPRVPEMTHGKPPWVHPGFEGVHIMQDVEKYISDEFAKRINELFQAG